MNGYANKLNSHMEILAVIPARSGSKGVLRKNMRDLYGHPLFAWSVMKARECSLIKRVIVSTDDDEIAVAAKKYGAEVPFLRPKILAADDSLITDVIFHLLSELKKKENYLPDIIVLLNPTSPFRTANTLEKVILEITSKNLDAVTTVTPDSYFFWKESGENWMPQYKATINRQSIEPQYLGTGGVFAVRTGTFLKTKEWWGERNGVVIVPKEESLDINDEYDFYVAEKIGERYLENLAEIEPVYDTIFKYDDPELGLKNLASKDIWDRSINRYKKAVYYADIKGGRWLDCACGSGYGSEIISAFADELFCVDIDPLKIKYAKKHYGSSNKRRPFFIVGDINTLPFSKSQYFDVIISIETIEHVYDCTKFIQAAYKILKTGGKMIISTPISKTGGRNPHDKWHLNELTIDQLKRLISTYFKKAAYYSERVVLSTGILTENIYVVCEKNEED